MKVKKIMMDYATTGLPTIEKKTQQDLILHLRWKTFEWEGHTLPYYDIKHLGFNLYALKTDFRLHDFCFRPRWYQMTKFWLFFNCKRLVDFIKFLRG